MLSKRDFELSRNGDSVEIQEPHIGGNGQWRRVCKRENTSRCSRSQSIRDSAITRRNACCSIAWNTLGRPRIFYSVCQRSKTTVDLKREDIVRKTDNLVPLVVPRLSTSSGSNSSLTSTSQDLSTISPVQKRSDELAPRDHPQRPRTIIKRGRAVEMRTTVCEVFLNFGRISHII